MSVPTLTEDAHSKDPDMKMFAVPTLMGRCLHLFSFLSVGHVSAAGDLIFFTLKLERKRVSRPKNGLSASWLARGRTSLLSRCVVRMP